MLHLWREALCSRVPEEHPTSGTGSGKVNVENQSANVLCALSEWTSVGSGTGEDAKQLGKLYRNEFPTPLEVQNTFDILDDEGECEVVVEARVSSSGDPVGTTIIYAEPRRRWSKRRK